MTGGKQPRRARAALQRWIWFVRFHLFQKRSLKQIRIEQVQGRSLVVTPGVFNPVLFFSSSVLAELLESEALSPKEASVLDLGCGTGVLSVIAASNGEKVVATDLNPQAVRCTRINAILNGVEKRVTVRQGDLFEPVRGESFDVVLFNPPYFGGRPRDTFETSFRSDDMATRFAAGLPLHLKPDGFALLVLSSRGVGEDFLENLLANGLGYEAVAEKDLVGELMTVYKVNRGLRPSSPEAR